MDRPALTYLISGFVAAALAAPGFAQETQWRTPAVPSLSPADNLNSTLSPADNLNSTLAVQRAMVVARHLLEQRQPAEAVRVLETVLHRAEGQTGYLELLRQAYQAELSHWEQISGNDARRDELRRYIGLLHSSPARSSNLLAREADPLSASSHGGNDSATPAGERSGESAVGLMGTPSQAPSRLGGMGHTPVEQRHQLTCLDEAVSLFHQKKYAEAAQRFGQLKQLSPQHQKAWAYCLIHLSIERLRQNTISPAGIRSVIADLQTARDLLPGDTELRRYAEQALGIAQHKARQLMLSSSPQSGTGPGNETRLGMAPTGEETRTAETASFRVSGDRPADRLEQIGQIAEKCRRELFERWSGPVVGHWQPKCEIILYGKPEEFARATGLAPEHQSLAQVALTDGEVLERRIHICAAEDRWIPLRLKRELMYVILADLFPCWNPPRWAIEGIVVLATGPEEWERHQYTLLSKIPSHTWLSISQLLELRDCPADRVTQFCCQSASLVDYLVRTGGGEKNFIIFLRDVQRYGLSAALKRQYGYASPLALEAAWKKWVLQQSSAR